MNNGKEFYVGISPVFYPVSVFLNGHESAIATEVTPLMNVFTEESGTPSESLLDIRFSQKDKAMVRLELPTETAIELVSQMVGQLVNFDPSVEGIESLMNCVMARIEEVVASMPPQVRSSKESKSDE